MKDEKDPLLLEHEADGIRELDNLLPSWWVWLFYLTSIFAVVYVLYYHVFSVGNLSAAEYEKEMKIGGKIKAEAMARFESDMDAMTPSTDADALATGKRVFNLMCLPCHREDGGGLVGPNLTDDYWIHGGEFKDSLRTIYNGVPEKGMVTWKTMLNPSEIHAVASYIYTLRGTQPPNPKPPENEAPADVPNVFE